MKNEINYQNIAYKIAKGFLNKNSAEFYLYWEDKMDKINISELSLADKVFVLMCQNLKIGGVPLNLKYEYNIKINEDDVYNILINC